MTGREISGKLKLGQIMLVLFSTSKGKDATALTKCKIIVKQRSRNENKRRLRETLAILEYSFLEVAVKGLRKSAI